MAAGKNGELGCSSYWFWFWRRQRQQHHHPPYQNHHASLSSSSSTSASASSLSSLFLPLHRHILTSWPVEAHAVFGDRFGMGSQRGTNCTVEGSKSRTCALLKCERQRRARTRHQEEEEGWCLVEERMLLSLPAVPARHPKLADQFLPGTAASSLSSGAGKRGDDDAKCCFCQASRPYQSSVQWILDTGRRVTRPSDWHGFWGEEDLGRIGGLNQAGEGPAPEWSGWSGSSIRGRAAGRHIVRRGPEDHDRHTLISTQPCAISTHTIVPSYLAFLLGLTFILSYPHTWLSYLAWYSYSHTLISTQPCALHIVHSSISTHTLVRSYLTFILGLTWITAYSHTQPCAQFDLNSYSCTLIFANHSEMCWFSTQPTCTPIFFHFHTIHALVQKLDSGLAHLKPLAYNDNQTSILYWQTILIHFNVKSAISRLP